MDRRSDALRPGRLIPIAFGCLLLLGCGSTVAPTASGGTPGAPGVTPSADPTPEVEGPAALEVLESGFTAFADDGNDFASFAIVLANPNDSWTASRMEVHVDFFDSADAFVAGEEVFVLLLPGQTSAIAGEAFGAGGATRMEVGLPDDTTAFRPGVAGRDPFEVDDIQTVRRDDLNVTSGRLVSRADRAHRLVQVAAVYRDGAGVIVGGASGGVEAIEPGATVDFEIIDGAPYDDLGSTKVHWQLSMVPR